MLQREEVSLYQKRFNEAVNAGRTKNQIVRYFPNIFLGNGHAGLSKIAKDNGLDVTKLARGEYAIFVNKDQSALKMYSAGNIVSYLKTPRGGRLDMRTIALIPKFFNGSEIEYDKALRTVLEKDLGKR